jgi:ABC-type antimicrobial peptide transport system permease subunit
MFKANTCQVKFRMKAVAAWNKLPGFMKISGYEQIAKAGPGILMSSNQMAHICDRVSDSYPELAAIRNKVLLENEPASFGLLKDSLQVKVAKDATRNDRLQISNSILAVNDDKYLVMIDSINMFNDMQTNMKIVDFFSACTSMICFILGMFQLIMTISANIKDSMWELGVLRSMGCTRAQITRVMVYELVANTVSAMCLGFTSGIIVSCLSIASLYTTVELPLKV